MPAFETITCQNCGDEFKAHRSARAADTEYCSPRCQTEGEGLA
ncbi:MAG: hypothetical protein ABEH56_02225 [Salinirussus sp.]